MAAQRMAADVRRVSTSVGEKPQSASASSVCSPGDGGGPAIAGGVREKRGAGDGWVERGADSFSDVTLARILVLDLRVSMLRITLASRLSASRFIGAARDLLL